MPEGLSKVEQLKVCTLVPFGLACRQGATAWL
eukprot:COSAG03_NODE_483_length_7559_cov_2.993432_1_plen_32_part_00